MRTLFEYINNKVSFHLLPYSGQGFAPLRFLFLHSFKFYFFASCLFAFSLYADDTNTSEPPSIKNKKADKDSQVWIDGLQANVEESMDATARWFDRFFSSQQPSDEPLNVEGRLTLAPRWSAYEGWKLDSSFRAKFRLPQAKQRFSAIVGRGNFDDIVNDKKKPYRGSVIESNQNQEEWILGLGFDPSAGETDRLYFSAGIRGGLKADLYTQGRYLWQRRLTEHTQLRISSTLFWRDSDGFGINERIDWEASIREDWLARVSYDSTYAQRTEGVRWEQKSAIYHLYAAEKAVAAELLFQGETGKEVELQNVGLRFIHRQEWLREWLFLEVWGGTHWPREELAEHRHFRWMFGLEFTMWYGS